MPKRQRRHGPQRVFDKGALLHHFNIGYSAMRMSRRLVAKDEMAFDMDETLAMSMPAFLRKKVSEGKGKSNEAK